MASRFVIKMRQEEVDNELPVSMIDVVFLLLIFFMCSMQFKSVERKLDAELPKDEGQNPIPTKVEIPTEIRVKLYWANSQKMVIHSPSRAFPENWNGVIVPSLHTRGAHVEIKVNQVEVPDLTALARMLRDLHSTQPMPVVLDSRMAVPFPWVIGAMDACKRAKVTEIKFQAPPVEGGGGSDWWWM